MAPVYLRDLTQLAESTGQSAPSLSEDDFRLL